MHPDSQPAASGHVSARLNWAGYALGFGAGGFFDGILLHQILQWHHLLSGLEQARHDIHVLILADGLFHLLMYVIAGWGLWLLWLARAEFASPGADRRLLANAFLGFGIWHIVDGVLSHWILGIHRIRMDTANPLVWDLLWMVAFGLVPLAAGWLLRRRQSRPGHRLMSSPLALVLAVVTSGALAALPPPGDDELVMVMFRPGVSAPDAMAAFQAIDARLVWNGPSDRVWAIDVSSGGNPTDLYRYGALLVGDSIVPVGCFDWFRA